MANQADHVAKVNGLLVALASSSAQMNQTARQSFSQTVCELIALVSSQPVFQAGCGKSCGHLQNLKGLNAKIQRLETGKKQAEDQSAALKTEKAALQKLNEDLRQTITKLQADLVAARCQKVVKSAASDDPPRRRAKSFTPQEVPVLGPPPPPAPGKKENANLVPLGPRRPIGSTWTNATETAPFQATQCVPKPPAKPAPGQYSDDHCPLTAPGKVRENVATMQPGSFAPPVINFSIKPQSLTVAAAPSSTTVPISSSPHLVSSERFGVASPLGALRRDSGAAFWQDKNDTSKPPAQGINLPQPVIAACSPPKALVGLARVPSSPVQPYVPLVAPQAPASAAVAAQQSNANHGEVGAVASALDGRRLYVSNLAYSATHDDLEKFFKGYKLESLSMPANPRTARPTGYAFVDIATSAEARRAVKELDGSTLLDRKTNVQLVGKPVLAAAVATKAAASSGDHAASAKGKRPREVETDGAVIDGARAARIMKVDPGFDAALQYIAMQRRQNMMT